MKPRTQKLLIGGSAGLFAGFLMNKYVLLLSEHAIQVGTLCGVIGMLFLYIVTVANME